jgi:alkylation response protein AidB-like acyl-CoA dehydrogenase
MPIELKAVTEPGAHLVALTERLGAEIAARAGEHDRAAAYPFASTDALRAAGYFAAPIPVALGGMGVTSVHDLLVAASRLARSDASVAIGVNMHVTVLRNIVRQLELADAAGDERRAAADAAAATLLDIARDRTVIATAISEPAQDLMRPATRATRTASGWRVDGRKIFCTMSPAATVLYTAVTFAGRDGGERYGYARIPADTPGVVNHGDWDALGMRASGSHSISFEGVELPPAALGGGFPIGSTASYMEANLTPGLFHAAASLGIAESAHAVATQRLRAGEDVRGEVLLAGSAMELTAVRGAIARAAGLVDAFYDERVRDTGERLATLFAEAQSTKAFVCEAAVRIVDRSMAIAGGGAYLNGSSLARAYRDVRAGAFMHPLGANRAYEFVARAELGAELVLH